MNLPAEHGLREIILSVRSRAQSVAELNRLIAVCHSLAKALVCAKIASGSIQFNLIGLSASDIAIDCVADLFSRGGAEDLVQLRAYFDGVDCERATDAEILTHLRRLVFAKVNHGLFRLYNDADPALGKILRNIKLAVGTLQNFVESDRIGETCIAPSGCDTLEHLPAFSREEIDLHMRAVANGAEHVPSLLAKLSLFLREQEERSRIIPLMHVAYIFRALYFEGAAGADAPPTIFSELEKSELSETIREACRSVRAICHPRYVESRKMSREEFERYFAVVERRLMLSLESRNGEKISYYSCLQQVLQGVTQEEFQEFHRAKLDYFGRLVNAKLAEILRKN